MQASSTNCERCGTHIPVAMDGLCPRCLLSEGSGTFDETEDVTIAQTAGSTSPASLQTPGRSFGQYELLEEIARGGMGVVYRARDRRLNRIVALKMILAGQFASDSDVERFQREAAATANLDHSGIVPIYEIGEHDGHHFFAMKMIEGGSLAEHFARLQGDLQKCVVLIRLVALAVHHAHQRGILHRDLKPANVLLDIDDTPLITDLGLAKDVGSRSDLTQSGAIVGTPAYMSPEQAVARKDVTTGTDIYAIGAMLYEALTGQPPHLGDSPMATLMSVVESDPTPPSSVNRNADRSLELICMKCLERSPEQRYGSAAALAEDLQNWIDGKPISLKPPSASEQLSIFLRSNLRSAIGAGVVGVLAGLTIAYCFSRNSWSDDIVQNPPVAIYKSMDSPIPSSRHFVFQSETYPAKFGVPLWIAAMNLTMVVMGLSVALVTRPKSVTQAFALGAVAALMASIVFFAFYLGPNLSLETHRRARTPVKRLAEIALSGSSRGTEARTELFEMYPGLAKVPVEERANTVAYRIFYDGFYAYPFTMCIAVALALLVCIVPCLTGTCYATKLFQVESTFLFGVQYAEFMFFVWSVVGAFCFQTLMPLFSNVPNLGLLGQYRLQAYFYALWTLMAALIYSRRYRWWVRWGVYFGLVAFSFVIFRFIPT